MCHAEGFACACCQKIPRVKEYSSIDFLMAPSTTVPSPKIIIENTTVSAGLGIHFMYP